MPIRPGTLEPSRARLPRLPYPALALLLALFASPLPSRAQSSAPIWRGTLRNASGAPISGATIRLADARSHAEAITDSAGRFHLSLAAGTYRLTLQVSGHAVDYAVPIDVAASNPPVALVISAQNELTVAAVKTDQATGGEALSSQAVSELPLNKRDFSALLLLAAGTMTDINGATNFTAQFAINGQRGVEATFAMDGADISDPEMGGSTFSNFNVDAVQEINSSSGWMPAEVGRGASGFTNIITRSGASGFHGSIFEFVRNSAFDARNYFDYPTPAYPGRIPPFRRNEFGFTNGGPVYIPHAHDGRQRTFYFVEYQGFRQVLGTTQVMPVPTANERAGIDVVTYPDGSTDTLNVPIPASIAAILARYPMPNNPTGSYGARTYATASKVVTNADQFSIRIDHRISPKDQIFARFTMDNLTGPTTNPDQTAIDPAFGVQYLDRQRNFVIAYTRTPSPRWTFESLLGYQRSTPGFPTPDYADPAAKFGDGTYEAFNSAAGSVMQAYGNLFHGRQTVAYTAGNHAFKAGFEARLNRDTTYFGISPNGEYSFGGGTAYATEAIPSQSGMHDVAVGDPLPDTLSAFLSGSAFFYSVAVAPPYFSNGSHIGPAAISRNNYSLWAQDTWRITRRFTLDYGLRWELYTPISERAHRTAGFLNENSTQEYVIYPQPGYKTNWNGFGPRVQASWQATDNLSLHAGAGITVIPPNIWQDNFLTGSTPLVAYPRALAAPGAPLAYGFQITPAQLPRVYTPAGVDVYASGNPKDVPPNTVMDVNRYEQDLAALTPSHIVSALSLSGIDRSFGNATLYTWTTGFERKLLGNLTADVNYVGTAAEHLPRLGFPNAYAGASPGFAPYTQFDSSGDVIGGFGVENVIFADSHSTYHSLQSSLSGTVGHRGPGIQASFTWSKSLDNSSDIIGGTGSTGAVSSGISQNPFDTHPEKGPSAFDVARGFGLSAIQDLQLEKVDFLSPISRKVTAGWELLSISSISSGLPFTVYSGIQQTGYGSAGVDRPDQIATPHLSTARQNRQDYFGQGADNAADFFYIPIHVAGGTGPNQGVFGTLGRNTFRGPAFYDFDFALIKDTPIGRRSGGAERLDLQFRAEFFNLFNIVDMGLPANILTGSGFGEISKTAGTSRQIQFSLKLIY
ncbi:MAG TPA: carboxypeptidase regulatory-like domain-containing protein [Candidatus Limnocylindrales bacterium]|nr:carboxypeptidase regulatory-like domain-containing protein [Candidatus Limnocylindrales bacterium]